MTEESPIFDKDGWLKHGVSPRIKANTLDNPKLKQVWDRADKMAEEIEAARKKVKKAVEIFKMQAGKLDENPSRTAHRMGNQRFDQEREARNSATIHRVQGHSEASKIAGSRAKRNMRHAQAWQRNFEDNKKVNETEWHGKSTIRLSDEEVDTMKTAHEIFKGIFEKAEEEKKKRPLSPSELAAQMHGKKATTILSNRKNQEEAHAKVERPSMKINHLEGDKLAEAKEKLAKIAARKNKSQGIKEPPKKLPSLSKPPGRVEVRPGVSESEQNSMTRQAIRHKGAKHTSWRNKRNQAQAEALSRQGKKKQETLNRMGKLFAHAKPAPLEKPKKERDISVYAKDPDAEENKRVAKLRGQVAENKGYDDLRTDLYSHFYHIMKKAYDE